MYRFFNMGSESERLFLVQMQTKAEKDYLNHFSHEVYDLPDEIEKWGVDEFVQSINRNNKRNEQLMNP